MKKNVKNHVKTIIVCAIFAAIGFVLDRFLGVTLPLFGNKSLSVNISFVPIFLAGFLYGPIWGALVGGVQDLVCCLLVPLGAFIPGITLSTMLAGALGGFFKMLFIKDISSFTEKNLGKKSSVSSLVFSGISAASVIACGVLLSVPSLIFTYADGLSSELSAWQALVQTEEYKTVFTSVLNSLDTGDSAAFIYSGIKIADLSGTVSVGFAASVVFGVLAVISFVSKRKLPAVLSAFLSFIIGGIVAFTTILHVPKALANTDISVDVTVVPYIFAVLSAVVLLRVIVDYSPALTKLTLFCLIATVITSVLNSYWISIAYSSVSFWVYLVPRLAVAVFIGVPLYTAILWLILKKVVPQLKKSNLL